VHAVTDSSPRDGHPVVEQAGELRSARVESLRAVAALAVYVGHVFGQANDYDPARTLGTFADRVLFGGGFGVYLFFALSGYLLFLPFARRDYADGANVDYTRYAKNRAFRILPLYFVAVIVLLLATEGGGSLKQWVTWMSFSENFTNDRSDLVEVNGVMWSLVIEVHFYIVLPFLAYALARLSRGLLGRAALLLAALGLASFLLRYFTLYDDNSPINPLVDYSLPSTFFFFVAGMAIALVRIAWNERPPAFVRGPLAWGETWVAGSVVLWLVVFNDYSVNYLTAVASALLLAACVLPLRAGPVIRALEWRVLALVGVASYSFYIWHVPILEQLGETSLEPDSFLGLLALTLPLCLAAAALSYRFIETPFLRLRRRWGSTAARTAPSEQEPARSGAPA
jgi:peptidoglycan/LPS O-acetylase OafA/YrhL